MSEKIVQMYKRLVFATCTLAFIAVVLSAYARLSDAGLGCADWPVCYEENAQKERLASQAGQGRGHGSWQWKLHSQVVQLLGILSIVLCGLSWKKRKELGQSPLLPSVLLGLMVFLAVFGILAFNYLPRPVIVSIHLGGGVAMLGLLIWMALGQVNYAGALGADEAKKWRTYSWVALALLLAQVILGGWVSSNFAALACTDFPLCGDTLMSQGGHFPGASGVGQLDEKTVIHMMHRIGALVAVLFLVWLALNLTAVQGLRNIGRLILGLAVLQLLVGVSNVLVGLPLAGVVLHNAVAMLLLAALVALSFRLKKASR